MTFPAFYYIFFICKLDKSGKLAEGLDSNFVQAFKQIVVRLAVFAVFSLFYLIPNYLNSQLLGSQVLALFIG